MPQSLAVNALLCYSWNMYNESELKTKTQEELLQIVLDMQFCNSNLAAENQRHLDEIANLKEILRLRTAKNFAPSSEQTQCLFDELELLSQFRDQDKGLPASEQVTVVAEHTRKKHKKRENSSLPPGTPYIEIKRYDIVPDTRTINGVLYRRTDDKVIHKVYSVPQKFIVVGECFPRYVPADTADAEDGTVVEFVNGKLDGIAATPGFVAHLIVSKFDDYLPFYRQSEIFQRAGLKVQRQKLAGWVIKYYEELLPLEKLLRKKVYSSAMLYKDETRTTVLNVRTESGKVSRNGFMYITLGTTFMEKESSFHTLVLCEYIQGRSGKVLLEDLEKFGYDGPVITDGLQQYLKIENHGTCWVHCIRNFKNVLKATGDSKDANALSLVQTYTKLSNAHYSLVPELLEGKITKEEFLEKRRRESEPLIKDFFDKINDVKSKYASGGLMGKAISYALEYRPYLSLYLDYVEGAPDTNCVERIAKCWATGRGNWLFSEPVDGADASSFFMSLIETAKRSGVATDDYIEYVLTFAPYGSEDESEWEKMLPWNIDMARLKEHRALIEQAVPDEERKEPYILCGNSR